MASVRLHQLSQTFDKQVAIRDISFEIPDGEFWVLVGPSGCGKSTILRSIAGLEPITAGEIFIGDICVNQMPARQRDVAMVFQNYALYPHMSVAKNLAFGLEMRQTPPAEVRDRVSRTAQMLSIGHLLDRLPRQLSGGQQQRVALGRAIIRQPQVFLLDEPLSNLDAQLRSEMRSELKLLHQKVGITTIYVTHDRAEAMTLADRIVVLSQGQIQQIGTPAEVYDQPVNREVATFIGDPPMNLIEASYRNGLIWVGSRYWGCSQALQNQLVSYRNQAFEIGLRAEAIQLTTAEDGVLVARVNLVEPLGRETLLQVSLLTHGSGESVPIDSEPTLNIVITDRRSLQVGEIVGVAFEESSLFIFDRASGSCIHRPSQTPNQTPNQSPNPNSSTVTA
ncbi:MAG: ABC transporter ATP-binding protein [Oscillatoriales cyanobacterium]|nr:MAG: ABC transporter ATP-binding protein [Oscillatoriales cyanobacterium]